MASILYSVPDISEQSKLSFPLVWQDINYTFVLTNNIRSEEINLEIKTTDSDGSEIVIAKNLNVVPFVNLMSFNTSEYWEGRLYIVNNNLKNEQPDAFTLSENYSIFLATEDEF